MTMCGKMDSVQDGLKNGKNLSVPAIPANGGVFAYSRMSRVDVPFDVKSLSVLMSDFRGEQG